MDEKKKLVVMATGLAMIFEGALAEEEMPHTHIETAADTSAEVMVIKSGELGLSENSGPPNPKDRVFTLSLEPREDLAFAIADFLAKGGMLQIGTTVTDEQFLAGLEHRQVIHKIGAPVIQSRQRSQPWPLFNYSALSTFERKDDAVAMDGEESDINRLPQDLAEKLLLPAEQVETTIKALKERHTVWIGNLTTYENGLSGAASENASIQSLRQFSYDHLVRFGMREAPAEASHSSRSDKRGILTLRPEE